MLSIRTNNATQNTVNSVIENNRSIEQTVGQLTTGKRINSGKDDAAGLIQVKRLNVEIEALRVATRNAADAQSLLDTIDTAYKGVSNILLKMREIAVQAANGTYQQVDRETMTVEMKQLEREIIAIGRGTSWGSLDFVDNLPGSGKDPIFGDTIFMGSYDHATGSFSMSPSVKFQVGADANDTISITISHFGFEIFGVPEGVSLADAFDLQNRFTDFSFERFALTNINTVSLAGYKIAAIDRALSIVATRRGKFAATNNRLDNLIANLSNVRSNLSMARGRIEDTDVAKVTTDMAKFSNSSTSCCCDTISS